MIITKIPCLHTYLHSLEIIFHVHNLHFLDIFMKENAGLFRFVRAWEHLVIIKQRAKRKKKKLESLSLPPLQSSFRGTDCFLVFLCVPRSNDGFFNSCF